MHGMSSRLDDHDVRSRSRSVGSNRQTDRRGRRCGPGGEGVGGGGASSKMDYDDIDNDGDNGDNGYVEDEELEEEEAGGGGGGHNLPLPLLESSSPTLASLESSSLLSATINIDGILSPDRSSSSSSSPKSLPQYQYSSFTNSPTNNISPVLGNSFTVARDIVLKSLEGTILDYKASLTADKKKMNDKCTLVGLYAFPCLVFIILVVVSTSSINPLQFYPGLWTTVAVVTFLGVVNSFVIIKLYNSHTFELSQRLINIMNDYKVALRSFSSSNSSSFEASNCGIVLGNPHVSIVSCWRNSMWQRIPSLLLAEGDIIALMGGDVTPGLVQELIPEVPNSSSSCSNSSSKLGRNSNINININVNGNSNSSDGDNGDNGSWSRGVIIAHGEIIRLRSSSAEESKDSRSGSSNNNNNNSNNENSNSNSNNENSSSSHGSHNNNNSNNSHVEGESSSSSNSSSSSSSSSSGANNPSSNPTSEKKSKDFHAAYTRHQSLPPDSIDLLVLSGNIRCFVMAETPIRRFCLDIIARDEIISGDVTAWSYITNYIFRSKDINTVESEALTESKELNGSSIIRTLFYLILRNSFTIFLPILVGLFTIGAILRLSLIPSDRDQWALTMTIPLAAILLAFIPVCLPMYLLLTEAIVLADVLSVTEASLTSLGSDATKASTASASKNNYNDSSNNNNGGGVGGEDSGDAAIGAVRTKSNPKISGQNELPRSGSGVADEENSMSDVSGLKEEEEREGSEYEFADDDIDDRAEKIADDSTRKVTWKRYFQYIIHILGERLSFTYSCRGNVDGQLNPPLFAVPFIRNKLLEVLGSISMVCFIDDDIISEDHSVTEEILLLTSNDNSESTASAAQLKHFSLHSSEHAKGSRFEDPQWWKHLPSLKPIGFNAKFTYNSSTSTDSRGGGGALPPVTSASSSRILSSSKNGKLQDKRRSRVASIMEVELVRHIRKTIPLTALQELSEEIGFSDEDIQRFQRCMELSVIAPRLGDAHILEDAHSWGQEATRRRGTLLSHIRSIVIRDDRGGYQMMSQGDPSLMLKYCREYWDGGSIAPLTVADRQETLKAYKTFKKEDFDVVAFAYTPIPYPLHSSLAYFTKSNNNNSNNSNHSNSNNSVNMNINTRNSMRNSAAAVSQQGGDSANSNNDNPLCFFYVDPSTSKELEAVSSDVDKLKSSSTSKEHHQKQQQQQVGVGNVTVNNQNQSSIITSPSPNTNINNINMLSPNAKSQEGTDSGKKTSSSSKSSFASSKSPAPASVQGGSNNNNNNNSNSNSSKLFISGGDPKGSIDGRIESSPPSSGLTMLTLSSESRNTTPINLNSYIRKSNSDPSLGARDRSRSVGSANDSSSHMNDEPLLLSPSQQGGLSSSADQDLNFVDLDSDDMSSNILRSDSMMAKNSNNRTQQLELGLEIGLSKRRGDVRSNEESSNPDSSSIDDGDMLTAAKSSLKGSDSHRSMDIDQMEPHSSNENLGQLEESEKSLVFIPFSDAANDNLDGCNDNSYPILYGNDGEGDGLEEGEIQVYIDPDGNEMMPEEAGNYNNIEEIIEYRDSSNVTYTDSMALDPTVANSEGGGERGGLSNGIGLVSSSSRRLSRSQGQLLPLISSDLEHGEEDLTTNINKSSSSSKNSNRASGNIGTGSVTLNRAKSFSPDSNVEVGFARSKIEASLSPAMKSRQNHNKRGSQGNLTPKMAANGNNSSSSSNNNANNNVKLTKKSGLGADLWPLMRQQVFLGLTASSVPIKQFIKDIKEVLTQAGVRFVYFSPRNMRGSIPVAKKIGIDFDWNCAISLRPLDKREEHDPHRYISTYADWDVHARMPHGIDAIKDHLVKVDNVPLLINLYTDSTPSTSRDMMDVFRSHGESVLSIGCSYRVPNQAIFQSSDVGVAICIEPGANSNVLLSTDAVLKNLPINSQVFLSRPDMLFTFRLVGIGSIDIVQLPSSMCDIARGLSSNSVLDQDISGLYNNNSSSSYNVNDNNPSNVTIDINPASDGIVLGEQKLSTVLETIRMGRVFLLNAFQALAFVSIASMAISLWPVLANALPMSVVPSIPLPIAALFLYMYVPLIVLAMFQTEPDGVDGVLKDTPRKSLFKMKTGDWSKLTMQMLYRSGSVALSVFLQGWVAYGCLFREEGASIGQQMVTYKELIISSNSGDSSINTDDLVGFWLIQDIMSCQLLLQLIIHAAALLERGSSFKMLPTPSKNKHFYLAAGLLICIHAIIIFLRELQRCNDTDYHESSSSSSSSYSASASFECGRDVYSDLDWEVWVVLFCCPLASIVVGVVLNSYDMRHYKRQLQFLRLEFDTRLGMHSPR